MGGKVPPFAAFVVEKLAFVQVVERLAVHVEIDDRFAAVDVNGMQIVQNAARQGARAAVRLENSNPAVCSSVLLALQSLDVVPSDR